jgi:hypothetical protein
MEKTETTEMKKGQRKRQMDKESGIRKGEHKREDTKGRVQAKKKRKTAKVRVLYWNVAGLRRKKEKEFLGYLRQFEIVGLVKA